MPSTAWSAVIRVMRHCLGDGVSDAALAAPYDAVMTSSRVMSQEAYCQSGLSL